MSFWQNPVVVAAIREILIAILVALLGLLGYDRVQRKRIARLETFYGRALADFRRACQSRVPSAQPDDPSDRG